MSPTDTNFSKYNVLYLEDEVLIAIDVSYFLRDLNFSEVKTVHRLGAAWDAISENEFDFALLDINVDQKQTSIELGEQLKANGVHVIFASGNSSDCRRMRDRGFHFIDKPFSHEALREQIVSILKQAA